MSETHSSLYLDTGLPSTSFIIVCSALVLIMTPGLGLFYSGLARSKNALSLVMLCFLTYCVITVEWVIWGFSLTFSENHLNTVVGDFAYGGLKSIGLEPLLIAPGLPSIVFCMYQLQFATVAAAIVVGAAAERIRFVPTMLFLFFWSSLVYNQVAYWTWSYRGWLRNLDCLSDATNGTPCGIGSLDYAGGGPVHVASGFAGLAFCLVLGKRTNPSQKEFIPHNVMNVFVGTALLWFGWLGFNGGSAAASNARAGMAAFVTTLAASVGGCTWVTLDYIRTKKWSGVALCSGVVAGLVCITPGSGYVAPWASIIIGFLGTICCYYGVRIKNYFGFDDSLDAFGLHGVGGLVGDLLTGVFAQSRIAAFDGAIIPGGWVDGNFKQVGYQLAGSVAIAAWSFIISFALLYIINLIPGLSLRLSKEEEVQGTDATEMGELVYTPLESHDREATLKQVV